MNFLKKNLFLLIVLFNSLISFGQTCKDDELDALIEQERKTAIHTFSYKPSGATATYDIKYNRCEWQVDPNVLFIKGAVTSYFVPVVANFTFISFDFVAKLKIDSILYHGSKVTSTQANDLLKINFPSALPQQVIDSLTIYYQGTPASSGFGSFNIGKHGTEPILWTMSCPSSSKDWWPSKMDLNDKIDSLDMIVTTPKAYRSAGIGKLLSETVAGNNKVYHWKTTYPIATYLVAMAVTNYSAYHDVVPMGNKQLDVLNFVYPESLASAQTSTKDIVKIITLYNQLAGEYPFAKEKYGHAQFGWGGGMEHQTMSYMTNFSFSLMAHECAHQWFGDHITCGSWQDVWLNEGFATYFEGLTVEKYTPASWKAWKTGKINNITSDPSGSVLCPDTTNVNRIFSSRLTYNKGAYLVHMLRWKLGDSLFFKAIRNYQSDPKLSYGYARTTDLKKHLETAGGLNLTTFFDQWFYKQGYPTYNAEITGPCCQYTLKLSQKQSHSSVSFFEMPVPIKFYSKGWDTTLVFNHTSSGQLFNVDIGRQVDSIKIDPELWILSAKNTVKYTNMVAVDELEQLNNDISVSPNPIGSNALLTIENVNTLNPITKIEWMDMLGNVIRTNSGFVSNTGKITMDVAALNPGIYFVVLHAGKYRVAKKMVKF